MPSTFAMEQQDDGTLTVIITTDSFGIFATYEEAHERAMEIMVIRLEALQEGIKKLKEEPMRRLITERHPHEP